MYSEGVLDSLIEGIYEAVVGMRSWAAFLESLATALESGFPSLYFADTARIASDITVSIGMDAYTLGAYKNYYHERNVWIRGARPFLQPGIVRSSHFMCPRRKFLRSEWYADFCRPLSWAQGLGATILQDGTTTSNLGVFADGRRRAYDEEDFALMRALVPHLQRGFKMHARLAASPASGRPLASMLEALPTPVLLVSDKGRVLFLNAAAESLVRGADGLEIEQGTLRARLPQEAAALNALLGEAAQTSARKGRGSGGGLRISRPSGRDPLEILISPLSTREDCLFGEPAVAALFVTDREGPAKAAGATPMRVHGLTAGEANVASALARGLSGKQACRELGLSYNTLKTHVRRIYAKTGAHRQSELVRLLAAPRTGAELR